MCINPIASNLDVLGGQQVDLNNKIIQNHPDITWHIEAYYPLEEEPTKVTPRRLLAYYVSQAKDHKIGPPNLKPFGTLSTEPLTEDIESNLSSLIAKNQFFKILRFCESSGPLTPEQYSGLLTAITHAYREITQPIEGNDHIAKLQNTHADILFMAIHMNIPPHTKNEEGNTLMHVVAALSDTETVSAFMRGGFLHTVKNEAKETPLEITLKRAKPQKPLLFQAINLLSRKPNWLRESFTILMDKLSDTSINEIFDGETLLISFLKACKVFQSNTKPIERSSEYDLIIVEVLSDILSQNPNYNHVDPQGFKAIDYAAQLEWITQDQFSSICLATEITPPPNPANYDTVTIAILAREYPKAHILLTEKRAPQGYQHKFTQTNFFSAACNPTNQKDIKNNFRALFIEKNPDKAKQYLQQLCIKIAKWNQFMHWVLFEYKEKDTLPYSDAVYSEWLGITTANDLISATNSYFTSNLIPYLNDNPTLADGFDIEVPDDSKALGSNSTKRATARDLINECERFVEIIGAQSRAPTIKGVNCSLQPAHYISEEPNIDLFRLALSFSTESCTLPEEFHPQTYEGDLATIEAACENYISTLPQINEHALQNNMQILPHSFFDIMTKRRISPDAQKYLQNFAAKTGDPKLQAHVDSGVKHLKLVVTEEDIPDGYEELMAERAEALAKKAKIAADAAAEIAAKIAEADLLAEIDEEERLLAAAAARRKKRNKKKKKKKTPKPAPAPETEPVAAPKPAPAPKPVAAPKPLAAIAKSEAAVLEAIADGPTTAPADMTWETVTPSRKKTKPKPKPKSTVAVASAATPASGPAQPSRPKVPKVVVSSPAKPKHTPAPAPAPVRVPTAPATAFAPRPQTSETRGDPRRRSRPSRYKGQPPASAHVLSQPSSRAWNPQLAYAASPHPPHYYYAPPPMAPAVDPRYRSPGGYGAPAAYPTPMRTAAAAAPRFTTPKVWSIKEFEGMEAPVAGGMVADTRKFPMWIIRTKDGLTAEDLSNPQTLDGEYLTSIEGFKGAKARLTLDRAAATP